jgi:hypothetical protein
VSLTLRPIVSGSAFSVYALASGGGCELQSFFEQAERDDADELASMLALLAHAADHGPPKNKEKSRDVGDGILEFKAKSLRVCYFYDAGRMIICTHGFGKPNPKVQTREIKRARELRETYINLKVKSAIPIEAI